MADGSLVRFEIGFTGGGSTSGQADADGLKALEDALHQPQRRAARDAGVGGHAPAGAHERGRLAAPARRAKRVGF